MTTITFYSYKGGTGRTLAVANVAKYFALFGQRVFVVDLDLEAPGLHYKLRLGDEALVPRVSTGMVDYMYDSLYGSGQARSLDEYVLQIEGVDKYGGSIHLMPAGNIVASAYWKRLSSFNWYELFYGSDAIGVPFFLDLKARIEAEYSADILLIDARTGITEIGGVAVTLLPDSVVCLMLDNIENLIGSREVLRSIKTAPRLPEQDAIELIPVLARIPEDSDETWERTVVTRVVEFLNEPALDADRTLSVCDLSVLHSELDLQRREALRVGGTKTVDESPLLRDYLRVFSKLISKEVILSRVDQLTRQATQRALDDPDSVEKDMEALAVTCPHPETFRALLRFYRLRDKDRRTMLHTSLQLWRLSEQDGDPLLWDVIQKHFASDRAYIGGDDSALLGFVESVWRAHGAKSVPVGMSLADMYAMYEDKEKALGVLLTIVEGAELDDKLIALVVDRLRMLESMEHAKAVIAEYKGDCVDSIPFLAAWARTVAAEGSDASAVAFIDEIGDRMSVLRSTQLREYVRVLQVADRGREANVAVDEALALAIRDEVDIGEMTEIGTAFAVIGRLDEFKK